MRITTAFCVMLMLSHAALAGESAQESRGAYNARIGDCMSCHTVPGHPPYAGGLAIHSPFGTMYSTNITPDNQYGIGDYSLQDFSRAVRQGIAKDGHHLYPAMPYPSFAGASDEDVAALYDYFMHGVKPVHQPPPQTDLPFPFSQRWGILFWNLFFAEDHRFKPRPDHDENWNRGAYLVQTFGHCSACHTPRGPAYEEEGKPGSHTYLSGGTLDHWHAPDLRGNVASGLGSWSEEDIAAFLKTGHGAGGAAFGSMTQVVENSTQHLSDEDRISIARYLKSLSPSAEEASYKANVPLEVRSEHPGAGLYASSCAACHQPDGMGRSLRFPKLAGNPAILSPDPTSLIRIVLEGGKSADTITGPKPSTMPAFAGKFTDQEIASVVSFIRQSWGNNAMPVSEREVKALRGALNKQNAKP